MSGDDQESPDPHGETVAPGADAYAATVAPAQDAFAATVAPAGPVPPVTAPGSLDTTLAPSDPRAAGELSTGLAATRAPASGTGITPGVIVAGRYQAVRAIGRGGMGEVWEVIHTEIKRPLALKAVAVDARSEIGQRLLREAKIVAQLKHPGIVDIIDFGSTPAGTPFLAMELVRGRTAREVIASDERLPWTRARDLVVQIADAIAHAHDAGVVHRDLKPANIFIVGDRAKVIDFGIAKATELTGEDAALTRTGIAFGTPAFMAPEQVRGDKADARADIYALGCVFYELLTGRRPFVADTAGELMYRQLFEHPAAPSQIAPEAAIPSALDQVVARCLRKDPNLRFQSMAELRDVAATLGSSATVIAIPDEVLPQPAPALLERFGPPRGGTALPSATMVPEAKRGGTKPVRAKKTQHAGQRRTPAWLLIACGFGIPVLLTGAGLFAWNELKDPEAEHLEIDVEPMPTPAPTPAAPAEPEPEPEPQPEPEPEPQPAPEPDPVPVPVPKPKHPNKKKPPAPAKAETKTTPRPPAKKADAKLDPPPKPNKDGLIDAFDG